MCGWLTECGVMMVSDHKYMFKTERACKLVSALVSLAVRFFLQLLPLLIFCDAVTTIPIALDVLVNYFTVITFWFLFSILIYKCFLVNRLEN